MSKVRRGRRICPIRRDQLRDRRAALIKSYYCDGYVILTTNEVKVGEEQEYEIVIRSYEAGPCGDVLNKQEITKVAKISISILWELIGFDWSAIILSKTLYSLPTNYIINRLFYYIIKKIFRLITNCVL